MATNDDINDGRKEGRMRMQAKDIMHANGNGQRQVPTPPWFPPQLQCSGVGNPLNGCVGDVEDIA